MSRVIRPLFSVLFVVFAATKTDKRGLVTLEILPLSRGRGPIYKMPGRKRKQQDSTDDATTTASKVPDEPAKKPPAKMTVAELKKELQDCGLDTSGKKAELVARLEGAKTGTQKSTDSTDSDEPPKPKKQKSEPGIHYKITQ